MQTLLRHAKPPVYRSLFPDWSGPRPVRFFLMENLLEARSKSFFPTNGAGPDEDVNVYLAHLLTEFLTGGVDTRLEPGANPLTRPPGKTEPRSSRADWYRVNGDHRLICQGLFDRGDALRRRRLIFGLDEEETRRKDQVTGAVCYGLAANLLENRPGAPAGLVPVLRKLEKHYDDYVHVLATLATKSLGLGAKLSDSDLEELMIHSPGEPGDVPETPADMDRLLDLLLEYHRNGDPRLRSHLVAMAAKLGVDPQALLSTG
ncbi:MAG: hypothetical protein KOO60_00945 [Gemmatimonadales bacterium]|nr:hypothetical protein [Gemmatimonadales bacterium]